MYSTVSNATRRTYPLPDTAGTRDINARKSTSHAHHGALRTRCSTAASGPLQKRRRSAWRATHSSWPTAGPLAGRSSLCGVESLIYSSTQLHLADVGPAEQALRTEDHERDQDREDDQVGPLRRDVALGVRLGEAEQEAAGHRTGNRADAADHRGCETLQPRDEADRHLGGDAKREQDAGGARQRRAEHEREDDHAVDVDSHHPG